MPKSISRFLVLAACLFILFISAVRGESAASLTVNARYDVFPVISGFSQPIEITLKGAPNDEYSMTFLCESEGGVIDLPQGKQKSGELVFKKDYPLSLKYIWTGATPTERPHSETITIAVPELDIHETVNFSIGIDLRVARVDLPETIQSDTFSSVNVVLEDAFHPDSNITPLFEEFGLAPELRLSLVKGSGEGRTSLLDGAVTAFFGEAPKTSIFPNNFFVGRMTISEKGDCIWTAPDGRLPGFKTGRPGEYSLTVTLKEPTGGAKSREFVSDPFAVDGFAALGLTWLDDTAFDIIMCLNPRGAEELADALASSPDAANTSRMIGTELHKALSPNRKALLGRYVGSVLAGTAPESIAQQLTNLLSGFSGHGVLVLTRSGVSSWTAKTASGTNLTAAPKSFSAIVEEKNQNAVTFATDKYIIIPFEAGKNFTLHISGNNKENTTIWKFVPGGVNKKHYPKGDWDKEITVHTGTVMPEKGK